MGFLVRTFVTAASLWVADYFLQGIFFEPPQFTADAQSNYWLALGVSAIALGALNAVVRPVLFMLSLPITCLTLGLFIVVLNGLILVILAWLPFTGFRVDGILSAIIGAAIISLTSFLLNRVVPR